MYEYRHDIAARTVYKFPSQPNVTKTKDKRGRHAGWHVSMEIQITRAENKLRGNQWEHATSAYPSQHFTERDTREAAVSYFRMNHAPEGDAITADEYDFLKRQYDAIARAR